MCEKSDGIRVLLFILTLRDVQNVFLVRNFGSSGYAWFLTSVAGLKQLDRHNNYYLIEGLYFPRLEDPRLPLKNSLIDGELVLDVDPQTKKASPFFLFFVVNILTSKR